MAYFLTFSTYGSWFHGKEKGSVDRKNNLPGTPFLKPDPKLANHERKSCKQPSVIFSWKQRKLIERAIGDVCTYNKWMLHAVNARMTHVHVVVSATKSPESVMNSLKSWCTRKLREELLMPDTIKTWSRHGSTRYLWNEKAVHDVCRYVTEFQDYRPGFKWHHKHALSYGRGGAPESRNTE